MQMIPSGALRKSILQSAIRGELNPRTADDARLLLAQVIEQRNALSLAKWHDNGSKGKPPATIKPSKISPDEFPFQIPDNWVWCRLGEIFDIVTGSTPSKSKSEYYNNPIYPFFKPTDLEQGLNVINCQEMVSEKGFHASRQLLAGTILVTCIGATIGKTGIIRRDGICNQQINAILPTEFVRSEYIYYCLNSDFFQVQIKTNASSTTLPILNKLKFENLLLPLPPLSEQVAIVEKLEKLQPLLDKYERDTQQVFGRGL